MGQARFVILRSRAAAALRRLARAWFVAVVFVGGVALSFALRASAEAVDRRALQADLRTRAVERAHLLHTGLLRSMDVLHALASLFETRPAVGRDEFRAFVGGPLRRQPELLALAWSPLVGRDGRAALEAAARGDGVGRFEVHEMGRGGPVPAGERDEYVPVYYIEPVERNDVALGYELSSDGLRREALSRARQTGAPAATAPLRLVQGTDDRLGFIVYLPVYGTGRAPERAAERVAPDEGRVGDAASGAAPSMPPRPVGFASAVFHIDDLVRAALSDLRAEGLDVWVVDATAAGRSLYAVAGAGGATASTSPPAGAWCGR